MRRTNLFQAAGLTLFAALRPAAAVTPRTEGSYICFFTEASAEITDQCRRTAGEAVAAWSRFGLNGEHSYRVAGHAGDAGAPEDNQRLSTLRMKAVINELVRLGVSEATIIPKSYGANQPLVRDTPLDPHNRFVDMERYN